MSSYNYQRPKPTAEHKPPRAPERKPAPEPERNPVWHSLALNSAAVHPKLAVSQPDDPDERDADRIAERVLRTTAPPAGDAGLTSSPLASFKAQRKCEGCEDEEEKKLQRKEQDSVAESTADAPPIVHETLGSSGRPLDPSTREFFEPRFGRDLGGVRVHADARAAESARAVNALAYTVGRDVVFGANQYEPTTTRGRTLLAHELAHVVQQGGSKSVLLRQAACPSRPAGETAKSKTAGGILPDKVAAGTNRIDVQDFAVGSAALPPRATHQPEVQPAMSNLG